MASTSVVLARASNTGGHGTSIVIVVVIVVVALISLIGFFAKRR